jgi:chromosomal replication initiator protein
MKNELDVNAYNTFFIPLVAKEFKNGKLIIEAPSRFVKEVILSEMFSRKINEALKEITNTNFEIEVKEKNELEHENIQQETVNIKLSSNLNQGFTFNNFVVGPCNSECYEASMAVALNPGKFYNPLFIYGRAGIGKTHLLHAIGNYCKANQNRTMNIYYTTANDFIDEFMRSNQNKDIESMKTKFKSIDMLLLDDVQFLAGKDKTGEVFFQIFNNLFNEKKQIVLTSDRNPNDLRGLEVRLVSRFSSGLIVGMNAPEHETAKAILKRKIDAKNFDVKNIDDEVLSFIAENYSTDVRQLEGALTRLFFYVTTINRSDVITLPIAMEALKNIAPAKKENAVVTAQEIKKTVCDYYNINIQQLVGSSRVASLKTPRFIAIYLCRTMLNMTFEEIGREFENRDHSTVMNACIKIEKLINEEQSYKLVINKFQQMLTK